MWNENLCSFMRVYCMHYHMSFSPYTNEVFIEALGPGVRVSLGSITAHLASWGPLNAYFLGNIFSHVYNDWVSREQSMRGGT